MGLISTADSPDQFPCSREKVLVQLLGNHQCFVKGHYYNPFHNLGAEEVGCSLQKPMASLPDS